MSLSEDYSLSAEFQETLKQCSIFGKVRGAYVGKGVSKKYIKVQDLGKKAGNRLENKFSHSTNLRIFESLSCAFSHFISKGMRTMWDIKH